MVILIAGETHTGKTLLAQKLLEAYRYPCLSLDHLKMGLIRSGQCALSPESDGAELTRYLWPIVREMIKTCIENRQNMIIEGCYIPFGWENDFPDEYRKEIAYVCLVFSEDYIKERYADIARYESVSENRKEACPAPESLLEGNRRNLRQCILHSYEYILMDKDYALDIEMIRRLLHTAAPRPMPLRDNEVFFPCACPSRQGTEASCNPLLSVIKEGPCPAKQLS